MMNYMKKCQHLMIRKERNNCIIIWRFSKKKIIILVVYFNISEMGNCRIFKGDNKGYECYPIFFFFLVNKTNNYICYIQR